MHASSNGLWKKEKKIWIEYRRHDHTMNGGENSVKIGDILFTFSIKE
jgi:hypothetical protein